ncbi:MAG: LTA synthase family protein [Chlamydiia bacterium]
MYPVLLRAPFLFLLFSTFTRCTLTLYNLYASTISWKELPAILFFGLLFDLRPFLVLTTIGCALLYLTPQFIQNPLQKFKVGQSLFLFVVLFTLTFQFFAEWTFWGDMECRFNFIAIDYLVYTHEVVNNILQSYPMKTYFAIMAASATIGVYFAQRHLKFAPKVSLKELTRLSLLTGSAFLLPMQQWSKNNFAQELSENGTSNLLHAFFHNQLNYTQFYKMIPQTTVREGLQTYFSTSERSPSKDPIARIIPNFREEKPLNVVLITVESLSQEFLDKTPETWTPFIQKLKEKSIRFEDHYATGTRTAIGLEALTLSVPHTPGSAILRRPHHEGLYSVSSVLKPKGYEMLFWYGGYGYFDNMNAFFEKNGFSIYDRLSIPSEKVEHETIWGVSDEHLFDAFIENIGQRQNTNSPFFALIMTTSNHRPYTFCENRISMPQGTRESAVRYTDWAIERFFEKVQHLPWFENTLFVITADHCASSAGKLKVDPTKYHTPCLFYAPKHLEPKAISTRTSQIDVIPTILGLLGLSYESRFYGIDQVHTPLDRPVPIGSYQRLGYFGKNALVILSPKKEIHAYKLTKEGYSEILTENSKEVEEAISLYQSAYERYTSHIMDEDLGG